MNDASGNAPDGSSMRAVFVSPAALSKRPVRLSQPAVRFNRNNPAC